MKWAHGGKEVRQSREVFKDINLNVSFCIRNTVDNILKPTPQTEKCKQSAH
jgi:hypothetical protein